MLPISEQVKAVLQRDRRVMPLIAERSAYQADQRYYGRLVQRIEKEHIRHLLTTGVPCPRLESQAKLAWDKFRSFNSKIRLVNQKIARFETVSPKMTATAFNPMTKCHALREAEIFLEGIAK